MTAFELWESGVWDNGHTEAPTCAKKLNNSMRDAWFCPHFLLPPDISRKDGEKRNLTWNLFPPSVNDKGRGETFGKGKEWTDSCNYTFARCYVKRSRIRTEEGQKCFCYFQCFFSFLFFLIQGFVKEKQSGFLWLLNVNCVPKPEKTHSWSLFLS